jgi:hypothetical protein
MSRKYLLYLSCFVASVLTYPRSEAQSGRGDTIPLPVYRPDEFKLALSSDKKVYSVDDPILLTLRVENISQQERPIVQYGMPYCSYWMRLTDEQGNEVGTHRFISGTANVNLPMNWQKRIRPSEKLTERIKLGSIIQVPGPGRYHLRAWRFPLIAYRFDFEMATRAGKPIVLMGGLESNEIGFEIR